MFEEIIKRAISSAIQTVREERERETSQLMGEIESFHKRNAIDKALETNDRDSFLLLTGGTKHVHQQR